MMSQAHTEFKLMEEEQLSVELIEAQYALKNTKGEKKCQKFADFSERHWIGG